MKKALSVLACLFCMTFLLIACGDATNPGSSEHAVHMNDTNFAQSAITIKKGESVTLIDDAAVTHIITNGEWTASGDEEPLTEPGAPQVLLQFNGNDSRQLGPFNTAGTFHFYCTIHTGMNLVVMVQ